MIDINNAAPTAHRGGVCCKTYEFFGNTTHKIG